MPRCSDEIAEMSYGQRETRQPIVSKPLTYQPAATSYQTASNVTKQSEYESNSLLLERTSNQSDEESNSLLFQRKATWVVLTHLTRIQPPTDGTEQQDSTKSRTLWISHQEWKAGQTPCVIPRRVLTIEKTLKEIWHIVLLV